MTCSHMRFWWYFNVTACLGRRIQMNYERWRKSNLFAERNVFVHHSDADGCVYEVDVDLNETRLILESAVFVSLQFPTLHFVSRALALDLHCCTIVYRCGIPPVITYNIHRIFNQLHHCMRNTLYIRVADTIYDSIFLLTFCELNKLNYLLMNHEIHHHPAQSVLRPVCLLRVSDWIKLAQMFRKCCASASEPVANNNNWVHVE